MQHEQLNWAQRGQLWLRLGIRLVGTLLAAILLWKVGRPLLSLLMPFLLALAAAALLDPLVRTLQRRLGWSRRLLSLLVLAVIFGAAGSALWLLVRAGVREAVSLAENWDSLLTAAQQMMDRAETLFQEMLSKLPLQIVAPDQSLAQQLGDQLRQWLESAAPDLGLLTEFAADRAKAVTSFLLALVVFLLASYFLCADYPYLRTGVIQRLDDGALGVLGQIRQAALAAFGGYLKAQLLLTLGVFFILLGGFLVTGQSYALLLALGLAVLDFIPLVGAGTVMIPWAGIDLLMGNYPRAICIIIIWGLVAAFRRVGEPKIVGDQTGLSPIVSLLSIYVGMRLGGVAGMILGPIVTLVTLNLLGLGLLDGLKRDVWLALGDMGAILRGGRTNL